MGNIEFPFLAICRRASGCKQEGSGDLATWKTQNEALVFQKNKKKRKSDFPTMDKERLIHTKHQWTRSRLSVVWWTGFSWDYPGAYWRLWRTEGRQSHCSANHCSDQLKLVLPSGEQFFAQLSEPRFVTTGCGTKRVTLINLFPS